MYILFSTTSPWLARSLGLLLYLLSAENIIREAKEYAKQVHFQASKRLQHMQGLDMDSETDSYVVNPMVPGAHHIDNVITNNTSVTVEKDELNGDNGGTIMGKDHDMTGSDADFPPLHFEFINGPLALIKSYLLSIFKKIHLNLNKFAPSQQTQYLSK